MSDKNVSESNGSSKVRSVREGYQSVRSYGSVTARVLEIVLAVVLLFFTVQWIESYYLTIIYS